jgi:hypothetical protein
LVEFYYNNVYQASLKMRPFEALYGRNCNTPVSWDNPVDGAIIGTDLLKEMEEKMTKIKQNLNPSQDKKKSYANTNKSFRDFKVGKHVFLKMKVKRNLLRLRNFPKLEAKYYRPFQVLENIGSIAYILAFPASMRVHNVFQVSLLKKCVSAPNHIIDWIVIQVEHEGDFRVELVCILD